MTAPSLAIVWQQRWMLLSGFATTVEIVALSVVLATALGVALFALLVSLRHSVLGRAVHWLNETMRCVPFMLFLFLVYFGLPYCGIVLDGFWAGVLSLTVYNAAYVAELLRGTWVGLPCEISEAGHAFGFHGWQLLRRIILPPVVLGSVPMLGNQVIQVIKDSAFMIIIAVHDLTYSANEIQATYYVPFAAFVAAVLLYWLMCLAVERAVGAMLHAAQERR